MNWTLSFSSTWPTGHVSIAETAVLVIISSEPFRVAIVVISVVIGVGRQICCIWLRLNFN